MIVVWTEPALRDREDIILFIADDNVDAAIEMDTAFTNTSNSLAKFPFRGRLGRVNNTRELVVHKNYILVYGIDNTNCVVYIKSVLHTAKQYPPE